MVKNVTKIMQIIKKIFECIAKQSSLKVVHSQVILCVIACNTQLYEAVWLLVLQVFLNYLYIERGLHL